MHQTYDSGPARTRHRTFAAGLTLALGAALLGGSAALASASAGSTDAPTAPQILPTPQSLTVRSDRVVVTPQVTLVAGASADASALEVTRSALQAAGAHTIVRADAPAHPGELTVYVGGADQNARLADLGLPGTDGLPAEGYELGAGRQRIVLAGADATGTFYAAQTLRQVLEPTGAAPRHTVTGFAVRDWPASPLRGVIEGFYGTPWSDQARLDQFDFYARHKMNTYVYSPKDDPYLRAQWRDPYPADKLAAIQQLVNRATADHVDFTYAVSPGLSVCYSSQADAQALIAKFQSLWDIGVRTFAVPLDDISYTTWNCAADKAKWGTGGGAAGAAQAYLLNEVQQGFIATHPGARPLEMVPTEYSNTSASPYKAAIAGQLDPSVLVEWTGVGVVVPTITTAQAQSAQQVYGHKILVWDNYPVNDYVTQRLLLAPYTGRDADLTGQIAGLTANPMIEPYASKIALSTVADYLWNSAAYDPGQSWTAALSEQAGGDARTTAALRAFADLNRASRLDSTQAPELAAALKEFWTRWSSDPQRAVRDLRPRLTAVADAPAVLRARLPQQDGFLADAGPWLDAAQDWGRAMVTALDMLGQQNAGHAAAAWADRQQLAALVTSASSHNVVVGDGVMDTFVSTAMNRYAATLGVTTVRPTAVTSLGTYQTNVPANYVDASPDTFFWSDGTPAVGDTVGVDLGAVRPISTVDVLMSKADRPDDYLHHATLEYSADGTAWHSLGDFTDTPEIQATAPAGATARYVRLRATATQGNWVVVRDFAVGPTSGPAASGGPAPASGSSLAAAADGDLDTAYRAAAVPASGEALTVTLPSGKPLDSLVILQPGAGTADATVQIEVGGAWRTIGGLGGPVTDLTAHGWAATAVRLLWTSGSPAPAISEIVPRYPAS
ncbi:beta-N-acetylglucosaminidase domain-containing protein [Streptomyces sp. NPDC020917]|uniref:beta-N-acetylglucosaminidase domain-containing protein n=1 Tax=Streptomyces sp. NPDC020917 TaxID=3365102 RepID=UPI00378D2A02